mmetsp:Transcript_11812/g.37771  ORF Transcript_11812/g.37771 Transcript_11812/m.37771 type:complete len:221 (+) Transcript_11812:296-958(+)
MISRCGTRVRTTSSTHEPRQRRANPTRRSPRSRRRWSCLACARQCRTRPRRWRTVSVPPSSSSWRTCTPSRTASPRRPRPCRTRLTCSQALWRRCACWWPTPSSLCVAATCRWRWRCWGASSGTARPLHRRRWSRRTCTWTTGVTSASLSRASRRWWRSIRGHGSMCCWARHTCASSFQRRPSRPLKQPSRCSETTPAWAPAPRHQAETPPWRSRSGARW